MANKPWIISISGTTKLEHRDKNLPAVDLRLSAVEVSELVTTVTPVVGSVFSSGKAVRIACYAQEAFLVAHDHPPAK